MQYTVRDIPPNLDHALRAKAREESKSLNQVVLEALKRALGLSGGLPRQRDLGDVAGSWREDPDFDEALDDQRRVDPELWR